MDSKNADKAGREEILDAIKRAVEASGGKILTYKKFLEVSKLTERDVWRNFLTWREALKAAGYVFKQHNERTSDKKLLGEWGKIARKVGRIPTIKEYNMLAAHHSDSLKRRFGAWSDIPAAFQRFAMCEQEWVDVLALLPGIGLEGKVEKGRGWRRGVRNSRLMRARMEKLGDRPVCGEPLYFEGMSHAPVNEMGVVFLFGAIAPKLGFMVESLRAGFPDCEAKRRVGPELWQRVRIEFEYESRNFREHGHVPEGCDLIVCWEHNWRDCPKDLKVIALREELKRLQYN